MEKLSDHLFDVDPIIIELEVGQLFEANDTTQIDLSDHIQRVIYTLPVDCYSPN